MNKEDINNAQIITKSLEDLNVKVVFGYTGGTILPLYDAISRSNIRIIINSNEQSSTFAASGVSRSTDEVGVVLVTSGPGITNTLTAVCDSFKDSIPLLVISGQVSQNKIGTDAFQCTKTKEIFEPICKKVIEVKKDDDIEYTIKYAYNLAKSTPCGPVIIDLPLDIQLYKNKYNDLKLKSLEDKFKIEITELEEFIDLLGVSKKPLLFLGGGVNKIKNLEIIEEFNNYFQIPFVNSLLGKGILDERSNLSLGMIGMFGKAASNIAVLECDLLICLGTRFDDRVADNLEKFAKNSKIIFINTDLYKINEIRKKRDLAFYKNCDAMLFLEKILEFSKINNLKFNFDNWKEDLKLIKDKYKLKFEVSSKKITQSYVLDSLNSILDNKTIITTGVGNHQMFAAQCINSPTPKSFLSSGSFGTMGFSIPCAIGAKISNPSSTVIAIDGDGSIMMNIGELNTIISHKVYIKVLLLNNLGDSMVRNLQDVAYKGNRVGSNRINDLNFSLLAKSFGFKFSKRIDKRTDLKEILKKFIDYEGSAFLEVLTDEEEILYPKVPPGKGYDEMILGPIITTK